MVVQNKDVFSLFLFQSLTTIDQIRNLYITSLTELADKGNGTKSRAIVINIFSSIGNPNLSGEFIHNIGSNHYTVAGIEPFSKWLTNFMTLPFEDLELKLIIFLINLLEYPEVCEILFEEQKLTKFLLKPINITAKDIRSFKNKLIGMIIEKGEKEWKGSKLEPYSQMIEKELQREKMEMEMDMMADG